jgi:hypothetical protein
LMVIQVGGELNWVYLIKENIICSKLVVLLATNN